MAKRRRKLRSLPSSIQAKGPSQQRIEQQRQAAQSANPNDPVDAAAFFQNLQPSLRQAILTDMEDSQIASLPPDLVAEAQNIRRDWEHRSRQTLHERLVTHSQANSTPVLGGTAYLPSRIPSFQYNSSSFNAPDEGSFPKFPGKPVALALMETEGSLLDVEALSSLLLMLFIDDAKFNILRLHCVIRHLCYHAGTREWIIDSLISIIKMADKTDINRTDGKLISRPQYLTREQPKASTSHTSKSSKLAVKKKKPSIFLMFSSNLTVSQPHRTKLHSLSYEDSPFVQLMSLLPTSVVKRSQLLTDKLVRLLTSLGVELPTEDKIGPIVVDDNVVDATEPAPKTTSNTAAAVTTATEKTTSTASKANQEVIDVHDSDSEPEAMPAMRLKIIFKAMTLIALRSRRQCPRNRTPKSVARFYCIQAKFNNSNCN